MKISLIQMNSISDKAANIAAATKLVEQAIAEALDETMAAIEARMETKVRKGYQHDNRVSPNMVYAKFVHGESRPVDGIPDPPLPHSRLRDERDFR